MALLIYAGNEVEDIHDSLPEPVKPEETPDAQWTVYDRSLAKLNSYFVPQKSNDFALFELMKMKPEPKEATQNYAARLRTAAAKCDFTDWNADKMIKCLIITNMCDEELRLDCLQENYALDVVLGKAQRKEDAQVMSKKIDKDEVNKLAERRKHTGSNQSKKQDISRRWEGRGKTSDPRTGRSSGTGEPKKDKDRWCRNCGGERHNNFREECPAIDRTCNYCKKIGHFRKVCLAKMVNQVSEQRHNENDSDTEDSDNEPDFVAAVEEVNALRQKKVPLVNIITQGHNFVWQPDTGASKDIWSSRHVEQYEKATGEKLTLQPSNVQLFAYGQSTPLVLKGQFRAKVQAGEKVVHTCIVVTDNNSKFPLLSEETARALGVVSYDRRFLVNAVKESDLEDVCRREQEVLRKTIDKARPAVKEIIQKYPEVFSGKIGCAPKQVTIMIDDDKRPVAQRGRKIPYNLEEKAESKLAQLLEADIVEKVSDDEPRTWISPPVVAPKPGKEDIRFCIDMRAVNESIKRPNAQLPTTEDVIDKLRGAQVFSKLDLKEAYHQFELDEKSRHVTTFHGPDALYRYKRLNYGTKSAQDILQNEMARILSGIPNQMNVSDDILIGGSVETHDAALARVLEALSQSNITVNPAKCLFDVAELSFLGIVFGKDGVKPDANKVRALKEASAPENKEALRSFLGMCGFSQRFIPGYAQMTAPLREAMTAKRWSWGQQQEQAFQLVRNALCGDKVLRPYQIGACTQVTVDAGPHGLGAVLTQKQKGEWVPVTYKSRSLKDAETRYSQTEREALGIRWGVKKLRKYLLGAPKFQIVTDHRPLCPMFNKNKQDLPPRIERFVMDIQGYDYEVVYQPGKNNMADYMSRHPLGRTGSSNDTNLESQVSAVVSAVYAGSPNEFDAVTAEVVRDSSVECDEMRALREALRTGDFTDDQVRAYRSAEVRNALFESDGIIYRGDKIVIPSGLRERIVKLSHRGHQGLSKTKHLIRDFCWFPGIDTKVEETVRKCIPCLAVNNQNGCQPPVKPHELPKGPWQVIEMDLQGPYPTGEYTFVMIDRYSKWPEIAIFQKAPKAGDVQKAMSLVFDDKGVPFKCQSDNGSPFQSEELKRFSRKEGFILKHVTPEWPRANGEVERFNRSVKAAVQKGKLENKSIKDSIQPFLRAYRASPHSTTAISPYQAMFGRRMKIDMPLTPGDSSAICREDVERRQKKMAEQAPGKPHNLSLGDTVMVEQEKRNKLTPRYNPRPARVIGVQGSMVTVQSGDKVIVRDGSRFKKVRVNREATRPLPQEESESEEEDTSVGSEPSERSESQTTAQPARQRPVRSTAGVPPERLEYYKM
jgi:hypothetical protein